MMRKTKRKESRNNVRRWHTRVIAVLAIVCIFCAFISTADFFLRQEPGTTDGQKQESQEKSKEQEAQKEDAPPQMILFGDLAIWVDSLEEFIEPGFKAWDEEDGDLTDMVEAKTITIQEDWEYQIEYTVTDSASNVKIMTRELKVRNGKVYLTFDDGPSSISEEILDILKENGVKATFFVIGENINEREDILKREVDEGHTIGLHGYSHEEEKIYQSIYALMGNFQTVGEQVEEITGQEVKNIRFPGGTSNTISSNYCVGIMTQAIDKANENGYVYWDWNIDSADAYPKTTSEEVYNNVVDNIKPGRTNMVLLHDLGGNEKMLEVLPKIIDYCKQNNYELLPIDDETTLVQHPAFN